MTSSTASPSPSDNWERGERLTNLLTSPNVNTISCRVQPAPNEIGWFSGSSSFPHPPQHFDSLTPQPLNHSTSYEYSNCSDRLRHFPGDFGPRFRPDLCRRSRCRHNRRILPDRRRHQYQLDLR